MNIILGSTSPHKIKAVQLARKKLGLEAPIIGVKTSSGQNEQPVGFDETFKGAMTRAKSARNQKNSDDIVIGIESGIFRFGIDDNPVTLDFAVIVILVKDRQIITTSEGVQFPKEFVKIGDKRGFKTTTVGSIIANKFGGDPTDPHSILSDGKISRLETLVDALVIGLRQI